ncbi:hypothetical protein ACMWP2_06990, partial [Helicobacter pylori]
FEVKPDGKIILPSVELSLIKTPRGFLGVFLFDNNEKGANAKWIEGSLNLKLKNASFKDAWGLEP